MPFARLGTSAYECSCSYCYPSKQADNYVSAVKYFMWRIHRLGRGGFVWLVVCLSQANNSNLIFLVPSNAYFHLPVINLLF